MKSQEYALCYLRLQTFQLFHWVIEAIDEGTKNTHVRLARRPAFHDEVGRFLVFALWGSAIISIGTILTTPRATK